MELVEPAQTVICANTRLARRLRLRHAQEQLRLGKRAWESPDILPLQAWLRRCREALAEHNGTLLNGEQESVLWQQIIESSRYRDNLLPNASLAAQAAAAWQSLKAYQAPLFPEDIPLNEDAHAFKLWAEEFRAQCQRHNWIDGASLTDELLRVAPIDANVFGSELTLVGFDRLTPQQRALFDKLRAGGVSIRERRAEDRNESAQVIDFTDLDAEIRAAAHWARGCIEADAEQTVAIITPQLRNLRTRIRYTLEDVLTPAHLRYRDEAVHLPFSISVGQSLTDYPLVHAVFSLLGLNKTPPSLDTLGIVLRTPFIRGYEQEQAGRALLDETLRSRKQPALSWRDLFYLADNSGEKGQPVPILAAMLRGTHALLEELPGRQSPEDWAVSFTRLLDILGWPGERTPDSGEYQLIQAWHKALDGLVSLRVVRAQMTRTEALSQLRRSAEDTGFQPQTAETPIQVLDPQGAAAMAFDRIWMLGLSEDSWPPRPHPNPFIPIPLQKQYGLPGADAVQALEQARSLQQALVGSARHIILSHARLDADRPLLPSPLLRDLPPVSDPELRASPNAAERHGNLYTTAIFNSGKLETIEDTQAPPVSGRYSAGGAGMFQDQSQCPFRAFAKRRLDSRALDEADIGMDAIQRGSLLHDLMQRVWSELRDQACLKAMSEEERTTFTQGQAQALVQEYRKKYPLIYTQRFADIEAERLAQVLHEWLELELRRAPFRVVGVEDKVRSAIGEVAFSARLDRVDELENGHRVIIDYKSGKPAVNNWAGERPEEPQLPLYALTHPKTVAALTFARLKRGEKFGFGGLAREGGVLPDIPEFTEDKNANKLRTEVQALVQKETPEWKDLFNYWRVVLENLAREFHAGVATVTPKSNACRWCDQQPLCRIHEVNEQARDQGDE